MHRSTALLFVLLLASCAAPKTDLGTPTTRATRPAADQASPEEGRLTAEPRARGRGPIERGLSKLALEKDALLFVPSSYAHDRAAPLMLLLHGAGAGVINQMKRLREPAEANGVILLAVKSEGSTWDRTGEALGPDAAHIDEALKEVLATYAIDRKHVAIEGFSDGASYALSLGLTNGRLFSHVIAFSAGFAAPEDPQGSPRIWVSHGRGDPILPIDSTARRFVPELKDAGYDVTYVEFPGGHLAAPRIREQAVTWFLR